MPALSGVLEACQGAQLHPGRHGHRARGPVHGLASCDLWRSAPGFALLVACECKTSQPFRLCGDGLAVCLKDDLRRRCGTHHLAAPAPVGRPPGGPPRRADVVAQHKRLQPQLGRLQSPEGIFPRPTQVAERCIVEGRDLARGEVPGAQEPGPWSGVTAVGGDPVARLVGQHRGRAPSSRRLLCSEHARAHTPTGRLQRPRRGVALACRCRIRVSRSHGRVPQVPRELTSAA